VVLGSEEDVVELALEDVVDFEVFDCSWFPPFGSGSWVAEADCVLRLGVAEEVEDAPS